MIVRRYGVVIGTLLVLSACAGERASFDSELPGGEPPLSSGAPPTTLVASDQATTSSTSLDDPTTSSAPPSTGTTTTTTDPALTTPAPTTTTTTTTTTAPPKPKPKPPKLKPPATTTPPTLPGVENQECVVEIASGESLTVIADRIKDKKVTVAALQRENGIGDPDSIQAGDYLDICVGNKIDDITGGKRKPPPPTPPPPTTPPPPPGGFGTGVAAQQQKLNELFANKGISSLTVDGDSGQYTEQLLCAARIGLGMPASRADMAPGSPDEQALMAAGSLSIPAAAPSWASRWAFIDETCQVMFVGTGTSGITFVFPTSTGQAEFPTRNQDGSLAFRYDPAVKNGGWHDSTDYPAEVDNPLNGNMYKPIYFDGGQAIHGANTVPPSPQSHGCARLRVDHQDIFVAWLGLGDVTNQLWSGTDQINLAVSIQGEY